ncbi:hypothetical protein GH714_016647 [Hevea brasiliensis]|uniref:Uncharacterized protein n=1 Tax=Hevea brasiliensis TaxID=3981 RepID=A0A6A6KEP9_HEVBR|nr:hypothetical protein GH714_016647 [Hevea brasiliensis]
MSLIVITSLCDAYFMLILHKLMSQLGDEFGDIMKSNEEIRHMLEEQCKIPETIFSTNNIILQNHDTTILHIINKCGKSNALFEIICEGQSTINEDGQASDRHPRGSFGFPQWLEVIPVAGVIKPDHIAEVSLHVEDFPTLEEFVDGVCQNSCLGVAEQQINNRSNATKTDIECLKSIKQSLQDPNNYLISWNFNNNTEGFICRFTGIDCWHPDENKVLNIRLSDMGLKGNFPRGIQKCTSLTGLDFSSNRLSGSIPSDISKLVPYVTSLDISSNNFSGEIPINLANCSFLNILKLDNNRLTGSIPLQLGQLPRMKTFSVANNLLSGQVPTFSNKNTIVSYANNLGLCGEPLSRSCPGVPRKSSVGIIAAAAAGGITFTAIIVGILLYYFSRGAAKKKEDDPEGNKWAKSIKGTKGIKASYLFSWLLVFIYSSIMPKLTYKVFYYNVYLTGFHVRGVHFEDEVE